MLHYSRPSLVLKAALTLTLCLSGYLKTAQASENPGWNKLTLHDTFFAEGAGFGDIDGDGRGDLVSGPYWWKGPSFIERYTIYKVEPFDIRKYSDNFFCYVHDIDGDGDNDVLVYGFPGKEARLYLNSGDPASTSEWEIVVIADQISHESPDFVDIVPGGLPEIVCSNDRSFGYYEAGTDPTEPWKWNPVSEVGETVPRFGHGLGTGDIDGDGDLDVIDRYSWWENPGTSRSSGSWKKRTWVPVPYERGGAQIHVHDVDGDGLNDIVTSLNGHGYGLAWFRQTRGSDGSTAFEHHDIMGESSAQNPYGIAFSQLHAVELKDIDGDGLKDIVTGKRWHAHYGKDPGNNQEPALYWFRCVRSNDGVEFVPYRIDNESGVGVDVLVEDLNGDQRLDVVSASKKGVSIHFQKADLMTKVPILWKVLGGRPDTDWADSLGPEEAARKMEVPEGFHVDLIASEPDIFQPIAMCFDARGRIWAVEGKTYPQRSPGEKGDDRILIFEDQDGDGDFETKKTFMENLNLVSGIEVGFGGVWIGAAPYLLFVPDANGDDVPDGVPEILLDGWGYEDTHETLNSFTWGPDGWLYGCHGVFTHSKVGKPGTPDAERDPINAGIWRYHPTHHEFEVFAWGTSNPWGLDFDENGDWFATACVIPHYYQITQGGRYFRQAGQHFNPYVYDDIETIADHLHYGDGTFASMKGDGKVDRALQREKAADTSALGGGHAHCGLVIYQADTFPEEYQGDSLFHNLHGHRIVRETPEKDGSGHVIRHTLDFALANDHAFIGVALMQGPDGAVYASDWHDPQTCHHRDPHIWDRTDGRIFRIRYGEKATTKIELPSASDEELIKYLSHKNAFMARQAQRLLQERSYSENLDETYVAKALKDLLNNHPSRSVRLRSLWTMQVCELISSNGMYSLLRDSDEFVRSWAVQFITESRSRLEDRILGQFVEMARNEKSPVVRRYLAAALQRIPLKQRWGLMEALSSRLVDVNDQNIPLLVWYGIEPLITESPAKAIEITDRSAWSELGAFTRRRAAAFERGRNELLAHVSSSESPAQFIDRCRQFLTALDEQMNLEKPESLATFIANGRNLDNNQVDTMILHIRARLGDEDAFPYWRGVLADGNRLPRLRTEALELLQLGGDSAVGDVAASLLSDPEFRGPALEALKMYLDLETAGNLVVALPDFPLDLRNEGINLLGSRADTTILLLDSIKFGKVASSLVSPVLMRQMRSHRDARIDERMNSIWGVIKPTPSDIPRQIRRWKYALTPEWLSRVDLSYGRHVFANTCGACHTLFDEGVALGPDLTGSNRANLDYILENVLAPNSIVGDAYQLNVITTKDGRSISGMVSRKDDQSIEIAMAGGAISRIQVSEIKERTVLEQSMMPAGLFDAIPEDDVAALVAYLASPVQVEKMESAE
ncbi:MAG: cytochrome C [Opitutaceae bacterium]|nr:cytochrome C [Opitutaceae bacterium]